MLLYYVGSYVLFYYCFVINREMCHGGDILVFNTATAFLM